MLEETATRCCRWGDAGRRGLAMMGSIATPNYPQCQCLRSHSNHSTVCGGVSGGRCSRGEGCRSVLAVLARSGRVGVPLCAASRLPGRRHGGTSRPPTDSLLRAGQRKATVLVGAKRQKVKARRTRKHPEKDSQFWNKFCTCQVRREYTIPDPTSAARN